MPISESNITKQQAKLMELKNQGYTKEDVLLAQKFNGFADNNHERGVRMDADLVWAEDTPKNDPADSIRQAVKNIQIQPNQSVPDIFTRVTNNKVQEVAEATQRIQAKVSPAEQIRAEIARINSNIVADNSRGVTGIAGDVTSSVTQAGINSTLGLGTGLAVAATAPNLPATKKEVDAQKRDAATLEATGGNIPDNLFFADPFFGQIVEEVGAERPVNPLSGLNDEAIKASQYVSDMSNKVSDVLDSDERKAQSARYERAKKAFQSTPEYRALDKPNQIKEDIKFTTEALLDNPLVIEDIGIQGVTDLGLSILTGAGAAKLASKSATKKSLNEAAEDVLTDTPAATKKMEDALDGTTGKAAGQEAAGAAAGLQGTLTEASSAANESVQRVFALTHEELIDTPEYALEYKNAIGSHEEKMDTAKSRIAGAIGSDAFVGSALLTGLITKGTGSGKAAGDIATGNRKGGLNRLKAVGAEGLQEGLESPASTLSTNIAMTTANPEQNLVEGVGESTVQGAVGGTLASGTVQAPQLVGHAIKATGKGTLETAKLAGKGVVGGAKLVGKGIIKVAPSLAKGTAKAAVKVASTSVKAAVKASGITFGPKTDGNVSTTPVADVTAPITASVEPIKAITEPSEQVASIQAKVSQVQDSVTAINTAVENLDPEVDNLGPLLMLAANTQKYTNELVTEAQATIDSGTATDVEVQELTTLIENISDPKADSIIGALAQQFETVPALKQSMEAAFTAVTTGNTEDLVQAVGLYNSAGVGQKVTNELKDTLMNSVLYSMDLMDDSVTSEQIQSAIDNTTGETKAKYEAVAAVKNLATVAQQVTDGDGEFLGINNHINNIKSLMSKGKDPEQPVKRLKAFAAQRTEKAEALELAITEAEAGNYPATATWGKAGTWTITLPKKDSGKISSLEATKQLLSQVRVEETLVHDAVKAVDTLTGDTLPVTTPEATTPPVNTSSLDEITEAVKVLKETDSGDILSFYNEENIEEAISVAITQGNPIEAVIKAAGVDDVEGLREFYRDHKKGEFDSLISTAAPAEQGEAGATQPQTSSEATPEQLDLFTEASAGNTEAQTPARKAKVASIGASAKEDAVTEATTTVDLELDELNQYKDIREKRVAELEKRAKDNDAFLPDLERAYTALSDLDTEIEALETKRKAISDRAERQFDLDSLDWDLGLDTSLTETSAQQASNLLKDILTGITGKRAIKAIKGKFDDLDMSVKGITKFLRNRDVQFIADALDYVSGLNLTKADSKLVGDLLGASKLIATGSNTIRSTFASLNTDFTIDNPNIPTKGNYGLSEDGKSLDGDNINRYQQGLVSYKDSLLWTDTDYLDALMNLEEVTVDSITSIGIEATEKDIDTIKTLKAKKLWFNKQFNILNKNLINNLKSATIASYDTNKLRFLLKPDGTFPKKIVDAAFMAYVNATNQVTESPHNTFKTLKSLFGFSDDSQLYTLSKLPELQVMGTVITSNQMTREFKNVMGVQHTRDVPTSVVDTVNSAMGGMLSNILKNDPELLKKTVKQIEGIGEYTGYTLNTVEGNKRYRSVNEGKTPRVLQDDLNFMNNKNNGKGILSQISEPLNGTPSNWVGIKPPPVTAKDTHIGSGDRLTDKEVEAENISRSVAHVIDYGFAAFHKALGLDNYKILKGYVENVDDYNAEHKLSILGKNQEILDSYNKADKLIDEVNESTDKNIYFIGRFSSVRRQQREGAVNDQGDKYHRALIGLKNNATVGSMDLTNLRKLKVGSDGYNLLLALAQAYGLDVDKQDNIISINQVIDGHKEFPGLDKILNEPSLEGALAERMVDGILDPTSMDKEMVLALAGKSDHELQGIITTARLISSADANGKVKKFSHYMKAEIDGLTNGPAHSSFMSGLSGLSVEEVNEILLRGGYLIGDGNGRNTHVQIGRGDIVDSYKTVAKLANEKISEYIDIIKAIAGGSTGGLPIPKYIAEQQLRSYQFLKGKKIAIDVQEDGKGNIKSVTITRSGTKNPVTVTVYGGGAGGIHTKMASELRDIFAKELTDIVADYRAGKYTSAKQMLKELNQWSEALTGKQDNLAVIHGIKNSKTKADVEKALLEFTYNETNKTEIDAQVKSLYGSFVTDAIDEVFKTNKRAANVMNVSMNIVTALANETYKQLYDKVHAKRVGEGAIRSYDTLSSKDLGLIQRKLHAIFPNIRTAIGDELNIADKSEAKLSDVGIGTVRHPVLTQKGASATGVTHSAKALGLPGVKAIPVLTISIDGAVQINNHLLQGKHGNFLNVLDAIDRIADKNLRASNEVFNIAEFMGIMQADTLKSVQSSLVSALKAQTSEIEFEGETFTPNLGLVDINDGSASVNLQQEIYRQSLKDINNPIANEFADSQPMNVGDTAVLIQYMLAQIEVERNNNELARNNYVFGNEQIAINQMAGINDGHANVVNGQVVPTKEAQELLGEDGMALVEEFNQELASRKRVYDNVNGDEAKVVSELPNTEIEVLKETLKDDRGNPEALSRVRQLLSPLTGLWQDMRGTFDLDTNTSVYKLKGDNVGIFKKILSPELKISAMSGNMFGVSGAIPSVGTTIARILGGTLDGNMDYLDAVLKDVEIHFTSSVTEEFPAKAKASHKVIREGKNVRRIITIREGVSTEKANTLLAHELIHSITQGGIREGFKNPKSRQALFVKDLSNQMFRAIKYMDGLGKADAITTYLKKLIKEGNRELALNEYLAYVGSEANGYNGFLNQTVATSSLSDNLRKTLRSTWNTIKKFIMESLGNKYRYNNKAKEHVAKFDSMHNQEAYEQDILATILHELGKDGYTVDHKVVYSQNIDNPTQEDNIIKAAEGKADDFIRNGFKLTAQAVLNSANGIGISTGELANATYESLAFGIQDAISNSGDANTPLSPWVSTLAEFAPRSEVASGKIDMLADRGKHEADSNRETIKVTVKNNIDEAFKGELSESDNEAVMNLVLRGDVMTLATDTNRIRSLLDNEETTRRAINEVTDHINRLPNVSRQQKNIMLNEALSLGARGVTGGAYKGLNLPNAKAIVKMVGTGMSSVQDPDGSITRLVDNLATLTGIMYSKPADRKHLSHLLGRNPEGVKFAWQAKDAVVRRIVEQYGEGKLMGLPKGFIPEQVNPNRAIKVVPWADRNKYSGYKFVREFRREASDTTTDKKMALLKSSEGGSVPYVQGAMSTVEAAIGGFTTTYGSATDKALPSITSGAVVTVNKRKMAIAAQLAKGVRQPELLREGMLPNVNSLGKVTGYRYVVDNATRKEHLETDNDVAETVAAYSARITEQQIASEFNTELADTLFEEYSAAEAVDETDQFVKVYAGSSNEDIAEMWRVIPQHTKKVIRDRFGGNFVYVRKRDLDNALGYREWSISKLWSEAAEEGTNRALFINIVESILGDDAVNKLRFAERVLQEGVVAAKDMIVVKSIVVPTTNVVSNVNHLLVRGVDPRTILSEAKLGIKSLKQYKADFSALKRAEHMMETTGEDYVATIADLKESLMRNPIAFMVEAGLLSTIVEDVSLTESRGTVKEALLDKLIPAPLKGANNALIDAGKFITITQGSSSYQFLADALEAGDFVAKFILYNQLMRDGMDATSAMHKVRSEFINYNTLSNKQLDYLNKTGGLFFFKYFSRIQPVIMNTVKENPTRALATWSGVDTVGLPSIFEALWLDKDITATSGQFDLINMAGNAHPINYLQ